MRLGLRSNYGPKRSLQLVIRNRLPSQSLDGKSPHEAWTGKKPTVGHVRKFGCSTYRHINKKTGRKKLHKKSMLGYLVGYDSTGIYRIYHPSTKTIKVSRDVIFPEDEYFCVRQVNTDRDNILPSDGDTDNSDSHAESNDDSEQSKKIAPMHCPRRKHSRTSDSDTSLRNKVKVPKSTPKTNHCPSIQGYPQRQFK